LDPPPLLSIVFFFTAIGRRPERAYKPVNSAAFSGDGQAGVIFCWSEDNPHASIWMRTEAGDRRHEGHTAQGIERR